MQAWWIGSFRQRKIPEFFKLANAYLKPLVVKLTKAGLVKPLWVFLILGSPLATLRGSLLETLQIRKKDTGNKDMYSTNTPLRALQAPQNTACSFFASSLRSDILP